MVAREKALSLLTHSSDGFHPLISSSLYHRLDMTLAGAEALTPINQTKPNLMGLIEGDDECVRCNQIIPDVSVIDWFLPGEPNAAQNKWHSV